MAVDKLVDSTQLDSDLTSVANAIRTAGGTSAQLAFPSGFVTAIGNISGGGGGDIPTSWAIDEYTPSSATSEHTIPHTLGVKPDIVLVIPSQETGIGVQNPQLLFGSSGSNTSLANFPYRMVNNNITTNGGWDYSATPSNFGWNADTNNIYLHFNTSQIIHLIKYYIVSIKF